MTPQPTRPVRRALLAVAAVLACMASVAGVDAPDASARSFRHRPVSIEVATYNLYLGADLSPLFGVASPEALLAAAPAVWAEVGASLPAERMAAVADVLARERPDVVGLQEVALWESAPYQVVPVPGSPVPLPQPTAPYQPVHDLLSLLLGALQQRSTPYAAVAVNENFTSAGLGFAVPVSATEAVRFTDRDVILVRADARRRPITAHDPTEGDFTDSFEVQVLGVPLAVDRGWVGVEVTVGGRTVRVLNTHLEAFGTAPLRDEVRNRQAVELAAEVESSDLPTIVVGDLNARPTGCQTARRPPQPEDANVVAYRTMEEAGLREVWALAHPRRPCSPASWTSGFGDLFGPDARTHRIDHIFVDERFRALRSTVIGDEERDRSDPSGAWPSDHAGSIARLIVDPSPRGGRDIR